jgi:PKD repeat protein
VDQEHARLQQQHRHVAHGHGRVFAAIVEVSYVPVVGLQAGFDATPLSGASPLRVQFTDTSRSSDPGGITSWEWDFDGDKQVDSTLQNPQWSFYGTGWDVKHSVTLTVRDASHPAATLTKKDWITVNPFPVASATEFGAGSTVPTLSGPIGMPGYVAAVNSPRMRGYYFKAPVAARDHGLRGGQWLLAQQADDRLLRARQRTVDHGQGAARAAALLAGRRARESARVHGLAAAGQEGRMVRRARRLPRRQHDERQQLLGQRSVPYDGDRAADAAAAHGGRVSADREVRLRRSLALPRRLSSGSSTSISPATTSPRR